MNPRETFYTKLGDVVTEWGWRASFLREDFQRIVFGLLGDFAAAMSPPTQSAPMLSDEDVARAIAEVFEAEYHDDRITHEKTVAIIANHRTALAAPSQSAVEAAEAIMTTTHTSPTELKRHIAQAIQRALSRAPDGCGRRLSVLQILITPAMNS